MERPKAWGIKGDELSQEERDRKVVMGRLQMHVAPLMDRRGRYLTSNGTWISNLDIRLWMETPKAIHDQVHAKAYNGVKVSSNGGCVDDNRVFDEELSILRVTYLQKV